MNFRTIILLVLGSVACGSIDPEAPVDDKGKVIPLPQPFDTFLKVEKTSPEPGPVGLRPVIRVEFSDYLDNDSWVDRSAVTFASGGQTRNGRITSVFSQKALLFQPRSNLVEGLKYKMSFKRAQFYSYNDAPLEEKPEALEFLASSDVEEMVFELPDPYWEDVKPIFEKKCDTCHGDENWGQIRLEYDSIVGRRSEQVDRFLVKAFDSSDSYLIHKILDDFDGRKFTVQPPPWSDGVPLTDDEVLIIDRWVELGARFLRTP